MQIERRVEKNKMMKNKITNADVKQQYEKKIDQRVKIRKKTRHALRVGKRVR